MHSYLPFLPLFLLSLATAPACAPDSEEDDASEPGDEVESSVVGGRLETGMPSMGYIIRDRPNKPRTQSDLPTCSGTLIAPNAVLTSAHCVLPLDTGYRVGFGQVGSRPLTNVAQVIPHPAYNRDTSDYQTDIAIVILAQSVKGIVPARLATTASPPKSCNYRAYGYGLTTEAGNDYESRDRKSLKECFKHVDRSAGLVVSSKGQQICFGDSGGPLTYEGKPIVLGVAGFVTSDGERACARGLDAGYTSVAAHRAFLDGALDSAKRALKR